MCVDLMPYTTIYHGAMAVNARVNGTPLQNSPSTTALACLAVPTSAPPHSLDVGRAPLALFERTAMQHTPGPAPQTNEHRHSGM